MTLWEKEFTPMLLKEVDKPFDSSNYLYELKFDGIRSLIYVSQDTFKIKSRQNIDLTNLFPELKIIQKNIKRKVIFDGEIISLENNLPSFPKLQKRIRLKNKIKVNYYSKEEPVIFIVFDILYENKDLTNIPLIKRKEILNKYPDNNYFIKSKYIFNKGKKLYQEIKKINLEGIIAKQINSLYYINERTDNWLKIKNYQENTFYIGGYQINKNTISLLLGEYRDKDFYYVGKATIGMNNSFYKQVIKERISKKNYFCNYNDEAYFFKPKLTCLVNYLERTKNNYLRQAFLKREN